MTRVRLKHATIMVILSTNGLKKVMSLTQFIKCTCITGDDLKKYNFLFSNPVKSTISYCDSVYANVLGYEINSV